MLVALSIGMLICSVAFYVVDRILPHTAFGRLAHRMLIFSFLPRSLRRRYALTGKHILFIGVGWKTIFLLCAVAPFFLKGCES